MTERSPAPGDAAQAPVKKPRSIPWTAIISIVVLGAVVAAIEGDRDAAPLLYHRSRYGSTA